MTWVDGDLLTPANLNSLTPTSGHDIADHDDVTITSIAAGEVLKWNGSAWINNTLAEADIAAASITLTAGVGLSGGGDLTANRTFTVDLDELTTETTIAAGDFIAMVDITDSGSGKITFANLEATVDHGSIAGLADDDHTQYHTDARALTWLGTRSTTDLPEGANLYFTDERVDDRVDALIQNGTGLTWTYNDVGNTLTGDVGSLTDSEIAAGAEIAVSKLADGTARQLLQTDAAGTGVEWTSNIDVPGTLDVTGVATFDDEVVLGVANQDYKIIADGNLLELEGQTPGAAAELELASKNNNGGEDVLFVVSALGKVNDANHEDLEVGYDAGNTRFEIRSEAAGTGTVRDIVLFTQGNADQLKLLADGSITASGAVESNGALTQGGTQVVLETRTLTAGTGLTGGGDLSANRTFNVAGLTDSEIAAGAEIAVAKLADGTARQLLQTDAAGTGVEWASNIDVPGTLDVTDAAVLDSTLSVTGATTLTGDLQGAAANGYLHMLGDSGASSGMRLTDAGHLALGTTDVEAWGAGLKAFQINTENAIVAGADNITIAQNAYTDGTWKYKTTDKVSRYFQNAGTHVFSVAASGTADTAITWTDALTIANDGAHTIVGDKDSAYIATITNNGTTNPFGLSVTASSAGTSQSVAQFNGSFGSYVFRGGGLFGINDNANSDMTIGLTINQGANDDEILAFKSSDVGHGMTSTAETDTYGLADKVSAANGGTRLQGLSAGTIGLQFDGVHTTDDTDKTTAATGAVLIRGALKSGTSFTALGADANIAVMRTANTTRFIFDAEGSAHADVEWIAFDRFGSDLQVLEDLETLMAPGQVQRRFGDVVKYDRDFFEREGLLHDVRDVGDGRMRGMFNTTKGLMAAFGTIREVGGMATDALDRTARLESALRTLLLDPEGGREPALKMLEAGT